MRLMKMFLALALFSLSAVAVAQSDGKKSFEQLKTLAGTWEGTLSTTPPDPEVQGKHAKVTLRVTSMGNAIVHEMGIEGRQDDPITMLYLDNDQLTLTHYCDAGNRPLMVAKNTPEGKTVEFSLVNVAGSTQYGNMHHAAFTPIDANHHIEEWTFMMPGDKHVVARFELQRVK